MHPFGMITSGPGAGARLPHGASRRRPGDSKSPRRRRKRIGRLRLRSHGGDAEGLLWDLPARYGGPGREAGNAPSVYCALRSSSASSVSTSTKSVSSPAGTIA
jgi:hypothetical protein